jgi:hypothetical protein
MFELPTFWNGSSYGIKNYGVKVTFNGMTSLLKFVKICQLVQELMGDRQDINFIGPPFFYRKESRQNITMVSHCCATAYVLGTS